MVYRVLVYLILLLLPFYRQLEITIAGIGVSAVDVLILLGGIFALAQALLQRGGAPIPYSPSALVGVGATLAAVLGSIAIAEYPGVSAVYLASIILKFVLLYLVYRVAAEPGQLVTLIAFYLVGAGTMAIEGIMQQLHSVFVSREILSIAGTLDARNELTTYLAPALILSAALSMYLRHWSIALLMLALIATALILSRGRAGTLLGVLGLALFLGWAWYQTGRHRRFVGATIVAGCAVALVLSFVQQEDLRAALTQRYTTSVALELEEERGSTFARVLLAGAAISAWSESPLVGIGAGNFKHRSSDFVPSTFLEDVQPHNTYLGVLAETGLLGLIGLLLIVLPALWAAIRTPLHKGPMRALASGITVAYLVVLAHLLTFDGATRYSLWLFAGMCFGMQSAHLAKHIGVIGRRYS